MMRTKLLFPIFLAVLFVSGLAVALPLMQTAQAAGTIYVDADATGAANGSSWTDAYTNVQDALVAAASGDQIWVAEGAYYPDEGGGQTNNDRKATFALPKAVALYGGFNGTETRLDQRDPAVNVTVLSGDIDGNDVADPNGVVTDTANIVGNNAYHVVTSSGVTNTTVLDGFTITAGQANGSSLPDDRGGGMYNDKGGSPALTEVIFSGNTAGHGGGMFNDSSSPALTEVIFSGNTASSNSTRAYGGGMNNNGNSSPTLVEVTFSGNSADDGGGMYNGGSDPTLTNVTFSGNTANSVGGGMYNYSRSSPTLTNVTFSGNTANSGGGGMYNQDSSPTLTNTIIANSVSGGDCVNAGTSSVSGSHNLMEDASNACGLTNGSNGNIVGQDPSLGPLTDYGGPGRQVFPLPTGSPAIDAGTNSGCPSTDQRGSTRPADGDGDGTAICDIGAYEARYALSIHKSTDDATPLPGQIITLTIVVTNTELPVTGGLLSDTLPTGLNFVGPITLDVLSGTGTVGSAPPALVSSLALTTGGVVTVTFPVTVSYGLAAGTVLTNTAAVSATEVVTPATDSITLTVQNAPPIADAGPDQSVGTNANVTLDGSASSDPNGDALTYIWVQTGGPAVTLSDQAVVAPTFTAPSDPAVLTFTLTVTDSLGLTSAPDTVVVTVTNQPPIADAGPDQSVGTNANVTLDGSASSDPDGHLPLTYGWVQTGGPAVMLSDQAVVTPTFTAPSDPAVLTFTLTVTDSLGLADPTPDEVVIIVESYKIYLPLISRD